MTTQLSQQSQRTLRRPAVVEKTGLCAATIFNLEKAGDFPKHFLITPRCAVWVESEIDEWIMKRRTQPIQPAPIPDSVLREKNRAAKRGKTS